MRAVRPPILLLAAALVCVAAASSPYYQYHNNGTVGVIGQVDVPALAGRASASIIWDYNATTGATEHRRLFFIPPSTPTVEIVVRVSHHWEYHFTVHVWKDAGEEAADDSVARFELTKSCSDVFDECVQARDFNYAKPTHIPEADRHRFHGRIIARLDYPSSGLWSLSVKNSLPHDAKATVQVEFTAKSDSFYIGLLEGMVGVAAFALATSAFLAYVAFKSYETRQEVNRINEESIEEIVQAVTTNIAESLRRGKSTRREEVPTADADRAEESEEDEEANVCRICRSKHPEGSLFSPCQCSGSVQFVHRECLDEWREKTQNPEHRDRCAECKTLYTYEMAPGNPHAEFARLQTVTFARRVCKVILFSVTFVLLGFLLKAVAFLLTWDTTIKWRVDVYHYIIGLTMFMALIIHYVILMPYLQPWPIFKQYSIVLGSLVVEVAAGYVGQFLLWTVNNSLRTRQVSFGVGFFVVGFCIVYCLPFLREAIDNFLASRERVGQRAADAPPAADGAAQTEPDGEAPHVVTVRPVEPVQGEEQEMGPM